MEATLNLDPELGDVEFVMAIEETFGIELTQADGGEWITLGDVHRTLVALVPTAVTDGACPTSMTFYRLRRALMQMGVPRQAITPAARLDGFANGRPAKLMERLKHVSGLELPAALLTATGGVGWLLVLAGLIGGMIALGMAQAWLGLVCASVLAAGITLIRCDIGRVPVATVGDLVRRAWVSNRPKLMADGARQMPGETWDLLAVIAAEQADPSLDAGDVGPETYLFEHVLKAALKARAHAAG